VKGNQSIKSFVQEVLGCTCPDQVFEQIEDRQASSHTSPQTRSIAIGGKLLVYIWEVDDTSKLTENIYSLLESGRKERDQRGLNRFRLVLATEDTRTIKTRAELDFSRFKDLDENMHLHVIARQDLAGIY
jgi:hypothetical protein